MQRVLLAVLASMICAIVLAFAFPPGRAVVTETVINAPPERVWHVLTDFAAYPAWNPTMRLSGTLAPGATIENREGVPGDGQMTFYPTLTIVDPNRELRWFGQVLLPRLFDANHYFLLRPHGAGTLLIQGEKIHGIGLWLIDLSGMQPAAEAVDAALKSRAESLERKAQ